LFSIAKKYGVTVDEVKSLNNLKTNDLNSGQVLKLKSK
jgi:LysM repeat protein